MKRATVVIGANWGDEGKGHIVDFLASPGTDVAVVRFNGGAQAGHTVVAPDGKRHVFGHFGSGTFAGASTYLAKHFVLNPLLFWREHRQLHDLGSETTIAADPRCFVTTPYDMMVNQAVEDKRGDGRHGSVGVGFGETIERNLYPSFQLWKKDLADRKKVEEKLRLIRDRWLPSRAAQLRISPFAASDPRMSDEALTKVLDATSAFESEVVTAGAEFLEKKRVIFEGAQGLCLDMDGPNFPHVTRSNTGLTNVVPLARALGLSLDVVYVTRTYLTKHGAGALPGEYAPDPPIEDETNFEHPYQGRLRFGRIDPEELLERIKADAKLVPDAAVSIALTWMDHDRDPQRPVNTLATLLGGIRFTSHGPRRDQVIERAGARNALY